MNETESAFGEWLRHQRRHLDLTQLELAQRTSCSVMTIRKLERAELRPSKQLAELLARALNIAPAHHANVIAFARGAGGYPQLDVTTSSSAASLPAQSINAPLRSHNLDAPTTPLIGRELELSELKRLLERPAIRLVTVLGTGGMGKTHVAQEFARQHLDRTQDQVFFVALASLPATEGLTTAIINAIGYPLQPDGRSPEQQLFDYLQPKSMLLVLDNFEHLLAGTGLVNAILRVAPAIKILVTSRERLLLSGETIYYLDSLTYPAAATTTNLLDYGAVKLFLQRARHLRPTIELSANDLAAIVRICQLVEGMPLGILLAAAWVDMLSLPAIADEISQSLDFLETELRDLPERHRSIRAIFTHSWQRLTEAERTGFMQLAVFRGGFKRQAAQSVAGTSLSTLRALVNQSLLQVDQDERYTLHELLCQYANDRLTQAPALSEAARDRHSAFYCALLGAQEARLTGPEQQAAMVQIEIELDNIRTAWNWAITRQQTAQLQQAMYSLGIFFEWRCRYQEGETFYNNAVDQIQVIKESSLVMQQVLAEARAWYGVFNRLLGRLAQSKALLQQSLDEIASSGLANLATVDRAVQRTNAFALFQMGCLYEQRSAYEQGKKYYQQALLLYQMLGDTWGKANVIFGLGETAYRLCNYGQARLQYEASLAHYRMVGDSRGSASTLERLGYVYRDHGQFEAAERLTAESIALYEILGDRAKIAHGELALGWLYIFIGRFHEAYVVVQKSAIVFEELGLKAGLVSPLAMLGIINLELGRYAEGHTQLQSHIGNTRNTNNQSELALGLMALTGLTIVQADYAEAEQLAIESIIIYQETGEQDRLAQAFALRGFAARGMGKVATAQHLFVQALQHVVTNPGLPPLLYIVPGIALLFADQGDVERAIELYAQIGELPIVANSHFRWDLAGKHLATLAGTLPAEVADAARRLGQASDLWTTAAALLAELEYTWTSEAHKD